MSIDNVILDEDVMVPPKLNLDCSRQIGSSRVVFYLPVIVGEQKQLVMHTWNNETLASTTTKSWSFVLYENGRVVNLSSDDRFKNSSWVRPGTENVPYETVLAALKDVFGNDSPRAYFP
jgi:hypothetical protein